jgi:beta-galactosidase GanA
MNERNLPLPRTEEGRARQEAWAERKRFEEETQGRLARRAAYTADMHKLVQARRERNSYVDAIGETGLKQLMMPSDVDIEHIETVSAIQAAHNHDLVDLEPPQGEK